MRRFAVLAAVLLLAACSSAPKKADEATDVKNRAAEAAQFGNSYYRQGRYDLALQFFTQALNENLSVDNEPGVVQSYNSIGRVYLAVGMIGEAESAFLRAAAIAVRLGGEPQFVTSNNLGELYLRQGDAATALATFERVLGGPLAGMPPAQVGLLYHNLGCASKATGDLVKAMEWLKKALAVNLDEKLYEEAAADYYMIASVHSKQGALEEAAKNAELALTLDKQIESSPGIAKDLYALGLIANKRRDAAAAYDYFQRSYLVFTTLGMRSDIKKALTELVAAADALGRTTDAAGFRATLADLEKQ